MSQAMDSSTVERPIATTANSRLYAFHLKLRPLQQGTLMPFSGELVHGAFLKWLAAAAPDVAAWLHEGQKRRLFTCSSLRFSQATQPNLKAERQNIHLPLDPQKTYTVRLTLLLGELFPLFHKALMQFNVAGGGASAPPFMQLGKQLFLLEEVVLVDDPSGWTGFTSLESLVEEAQQVRFGGNAPLTLEFASLTTFSRGSAKVRYGAHHVMFPQPTFVFQNLLRRWEDVAPPELAGVVQQERIEQYLQEDGIIVVDYDLKTHQVHFTTHPQRGFVGACTYQLRGPDEKSDEADTPLTVRQQMYLLARLAFYSGVGYKTAMGLGQVRPLIGSSPKHA
ncbi:MAG TPA: CRISPR system precrRNA processing endoribonuclease RAMP protein Cas6 [Ktedonobacteraceae bacterium]|nr:CRISPR system precrRNA processing endoribonuclease RAMP protein Cas6 [Ktedonobacteraceae bacterium]